MSRATKRKHVQMEFLKDDYSLPKEGQDIVKVLSSRGNNLHEVEAANGETYLVSMPTKFRRNVWVKRGDFILVEPIDEGDKVKAEMVRLLTGEHVKYFKQNGAWPEAFSSADVQIDKTDDDLFVNTNRQQLGAVSTSESDDSDESDSDLSEH